MYILCFSFLTDLLSQLATGGFDIGANYMQVISRTVYFKYGNIKMVNRKLHNYRDLLWHCTEEITNKTIIHLRSSQIGSQQARKQSHLAQNVAISNSI